MVIGSGAIQRAIQRLDSIMPVQPKHEMTCEDRAQAAWGNLAVDRPGLRIEAVRAVVCPDETKEA